jgi:hypothetical protein
MGRVKKKEHEKLTRANISNVISLLKPTESGKKSITKKDACQILNISYNTTRLAKIISEFEEHEEYVNKQKAAKRGKRATESEITQAVQEYLAGETVANIAKGLFRSNGFINAIIERLGVPHRPTSVEGRTQVDFLPDACVAESFEIGETVWSAKYHATAIVKNELETKHDGKCYQVYVIEAFEQREDSFFPGVLHGGFNAYCLAYDLGKLSHLKKYGV